MTSIHKDGGTVETHLFIHRRRCDSNKMTNAQLGKRKQQSFCAADRVPRIGSARETDIGRGEGLRIGSRRASRPLRQVEAGALADHARLDVWVE